MTYSAHQPAWPSILLTGTYSSWNKGDAAMQFSTAMAIRSRWPEARVVVSAPFPEQDEPFYADVAQVVPCRRRRLIWASFQIVRVGLWRLVRGLTGYTPDWLIMDAELRATRDADLVIDLSGDMLTDDYGPHVAWSHYIPIINALLLERPVFICAQSIGPFRWTGSIARWIFGRAGAITVRDAISLQHLLAIGIDETLVEMTADMAFLLESASARRVDEIFNIENVHLDGRPMLGISVSRILEKRHAVSHSDANGSFVQVLAAALDRFSDAHGVETVFVPHVTGPTPAKDDRLIAEEVAAAMRTPAHVLQGDYRPEEIKGVIARCALFLGARMHANIAALSTGVPVVALSYSHKTPGIMAQFGQSGQVIDGREISASSLEANMDAAWVKRDDSTRKIRQAFAILKLQAMRNLDIATSLMTKPSRSGMQSE